MRLPVGTRGVGDGEEAEMIVVIYWFGAYLALAGILWAASAFIDWWMRRQEAKYREEVTRLWASCVAYKRALAEFDAVAAAAWERGRRDD